MKKEIVSVFVVFVLAFSASGQFVGEGGPRPTQTTSTSQVNFTFKFGRALPTGEFKTLPARTANPQFASGVMGAKNGMFIEAGLSMNFNGTDNPVGFYYYPLVVSYMQTPLDWSGLGGFFSNKAVYTKPFALLDIGQRYGVVVRPVTNLSFAVYYRPAFILPFNFEVVHESTANGESFLFSGEIGSSGAAPVFMMSHTAGLEIRYNLVSVALELYSARPTFDVQYRDLDTNPVMAVDQTSTVKIPVKLMLLSLAVHL
jgi:hypothetical protein